MEKIGICIVGAAGRMGKKIASIALQDEEITLPGAVDSHFSELIGKDIGEIVLSETSGVEVSSDISLSSINADVLIDFTSAEATISNLKTYANLNKPIVIGSTGFSEEQIRKIKKLGGTVPVLQSPNMSMGVNLTFKIIEMVSNAIGNIYDIEIIEAHHRKKKDAPSGTASKIAEIICKATNRDINNDMVYSRRGLIGERTDKEIGMQVIRGGDIVGEHTVMFCGDSERIEIKHKASSRDVFASGAIQAAKWIVGKPAGNYSMFDVLGL